MDLAGLARLQNDADARPLMSTDQVMVHGPAGYQRAEWHFHRRDCPVRQNDQRITFFDRFGRFPADSIQCLHHARLATALVEGDVDDAGTPAPVIHLLQRAQLLVGQNRMRHPQAVCMLFRGFQQVSFRPDEAFQRHHHFLPNGVDGRVCYLREQLLEIVVDHPGLVGQARQCTVIAHGTEGVPGFRYHRQQHELHRFHGIAECLHARHKRLRIETVVIRHLGYFVQFDLMVFQPLAIGAAHREFVLEFLVGHHAARFEIDQEHSAGPQSSLLLDVGRVDRQYPDLRSHDDLVVMGHVIPRWSQAVAIQYGADIVAIGKHDGCGPVPGFHQR